MFVVSQLRVNYSTACTLLPNNQSFIDSHEKGGAVSGVGQW